MPRFRSPTCYEEAMQRLSADRQMIHAVCLAVVLALMTGCEPTPTPMTYQGEQDAWVIRTDFSDNEKWLAVRELISLPQVNVGHTFYAYVNYVSDEKYAGMEPDALVHALPDDYPQFFCFIVDETALTNEEHAILVVEFSPNTLNPKDYERPPSQTPSTDIKTFRAIPSTIQSIENNLSIGNMDFEEFAISVDADGVFRGFPR